MSDCGCEIELVEYAQSTELIADLFDMIADANNELNTIKSGNT